MSIRLFTQSRVGALASALCLAIAMAAPARAAYPETTIKLVVGFPPGGGGDTYARLVAEHMQRSMGKTLVVENKPGAGGNLAADNVAKAKPDGHTLLFAMSGNVALAPVMRGDKLPYKTPDDFTLIGSAVEAPHGLFVAANSRYRSANEFFAAAKTEGLSFASTGAGGAAHIGMEMVLKAAQVKVLHVPYRGSGPAVIDVGAGRVDIMFDAVPSLLALIQGDKLRPLAAASAARNPVLPDVPTFAELGIKGMDISLWYGVTGPSGLPPAVVQRLNAEIDKILKLPDVAQSFAKQGAVPGGGTPYLYAEFMRAESARWGDVVQKNNIPKLD
jgi:tripartite-type tricarboxylate transporter receptor subunit TctC